MNRFYSIDVLRGLIMIVMALDHTLGAVSFGHPIELELPAVTSKGRDPNHFPGYDSPIQQWSRLVTHVCAPGFQLLAGMGLAISVARSRRRGVAQAAITRDLAFRGIVLILVDWFILSFTVYQAPFMFLVLCCIGASTLCFLVLRFLPSPLIGLLGLGIIFAAPWYAPAAVRDASLEMYFLYAWRDVAFGNQGWFNVLYPILPWLGCFALGWWIGLELHERQDGASIRRQSLFLIGGGSALFLIGFGLRWGGFAFAERIPLHGATPLDAWFWQFAKYPPTLVFLLLPLGVLFVGLGLLRRFDLQHAVPSWGRWISVYGRTALFYFVIHFYALGVINFAIRRYAPTHLHPPFDYGNAYLVWIGVVLLLWPVCRGYDKLRQRFRAVLRYF